MDHCSDILSFKDGGGETKESKKTNKKGWKIVVRIYMVSVEVGFG